MQPLPPLTAHGCHFDVFDVTRDLAAGRPLEGFVRETKRRSDVVFATRVLPSTRTALRSIQHVNDNDNGVVLLVRGTFIAFKREVSHEELQASFPQLLDDGLCEKCGADPNPAAICMNCNTILCQACRPDFGSSHCAICSGQAEKVRVLQMPLNPSAYSPHFTRRGAAAEELPGRGGENHRCSGEDCY